MSNPDLLLYVVHVALWSSFGATRLILRRHASDSGIPTSGTLATSQEYTAAFSRTVLAFHVFGFAVFYFGIADAGHRRVSAWFPGQSIVGALVIALGAALIWWAVASFHSFWRFRAKLDRGHELATKGAFGLLRHPIYAGMNLVALGSAMWEPTAIVWIGFALIAFGSVLRARLEESLLRRVFGSAYIDYSKRTKRFIPHVY